MESSSNSDNGAPGPELEEVPEIDLYAPPYDENIANTRRQKFLTKKHSIPEKMQLYTCST